MRAFLPAFKQIHFDKIEEDLNELLKKNEGIINQLCAQEHFTWDNLLKPLDALIEKLGQFWEPIVALDCVAKSDLLKEIISKCLPKITNYKISLKQNEKLFRAILSVKARADFETLTPAQKMMVNNLLRDFKLNGIELSPEKKLLFSNLSMELAQQKQTFKNNLSSSKNAFTKHITDETQLSGISEHIKKSARAAAQKKNLAGYLLTLSPPEYSAVITYADSAELRYEFYRANVTCATDLNSDTKQFDNTPIINKILCIRFELAKLLGFDNHAQLSLANKMARSTDEVMRFLNELIQKSHPTAENEYNELAVFARTRLNIEKLNAWDAAYASEKLRQEKYAFSAEELRPYFPEDKVLSGLFSIIHRLYGISVEKIDHVETWDAHVKCFILKDTQQNPIAYLYMDLYARAGNKRGGAWMGSFANRRRLENGDLALPVAHVNCNFSAPIDDKQPALLLPNEVVTLFHECGHALQHMLSEIDIAYISGLSSIPFDAVEIASQFFEGWAKKESSLHVFAAHHQTSEPIPTQLLQRLERAEGFQSAMKAMRQLELALFDFRLHREFDGTNVQTILNNVRETVSVIPTPDFNRFQNGFFHIFCDEYDAGYYSYKWAEAMAADLFSLFEEKGLFDTTASSNFKRTFLQSGGAVHPMVLFVQCRGRELSIDPLLRRSGIIPLVNTTPVVQLQGHTFNFNRKRSLGEREKNMGEENATTHQHVA